MSTPMVAVNLTSGTQWHLAYSFFVESAGLVDVFRALHDSFVRGDDVVKLKYPQDQALIGKLENTLNVAYLRSFSTVAQSPEQQRMNAYWRLFGEQIAGRQFVPNAPRYNASFRKNFEDAMVEVFKLILDENNQQVKLGNPAAVAELLNNLRRGLLDHQHNLMFDTAQDGAAVMQFLYALLRDDPLMADRLGIRATTDAGKLRELAERLRVPVTKEIAEATHRFKLSIQMNVFLLDVETPPFPNSPEWTSSIAEQYVKSHIQMFGEIATAWHQITGKDFRDLAAKGRSETLVVSQPRQ